MSSDADATIAPETDAKKLDPVESVIAEIMNTDPPQGPTPDCLPVEAKQEFDLPSLADMTLHEWITVLTHPTTGQYPNGITTRMMDSLVKQMGVTQFPSPDRRRYLNVWKTIGHFAVYLSEAARKGRIRRISLGTYIGIFGNEDGGDPNLDVQSKSLQPVPLLNSLNMSAGRFSSKRKSFFPRRYPAFNNAKRVCITPLASADSGAQNDQANNSNGRPPSRDSINGGSGSSTDDCPISQKNGKTAVRQTGRKLDVVQGDRSIFSVGTGRRDAAHKAIPILNSSSLEKKKLGTIPNPPPLIGHHICRNRSLASHQGDAYKTGNMDEFGLPSLLKADPSLDTATMESLSALSSQDVAQLCEKFGFDDGAKALAREEVDGTALLLMTREDITHSLGLKLGPALKLHRLVRTLQFVAKRSQ